MGRLLILGAGYLGRELLIQAIKSGYTVDALSRNPETCTTLKELGAKKTVAAMLGSSNWHSAFNQADYAAVVVCVGSSQRDAEGYQESYVKGLQSVLTWGDNAIDKLFYTSSISVYGESDGQWIDEQTKPAPQDWRGEIMLEAEALLDTGSTPVAEHIILRLGGIWGPNRDRFIGNRVSVDESNPDAYYLNLIHVADAANVILNMAKAPTRAGTHIYNLTDNKPFLKLPSAEMKRSRPNRRIDSSAIQQTFSWYPQYLPFASS